MIKIITVSLTGLIPQNVGAYPNPRPEFPTSNIVVFLWAVLLY
jgi:hypothetical protein